MKKCLLWRVGALSHAALGHFPAQTCFSFVWLPIPWQRTCALLSRNPLHKVRSVTLSSLDFRPGELCVTPSALTSAFSAASSFASLSPTTPVAATETKFTSYPQLWLRLREALSVGPQNHFGPGCCSAGISGVLNGEMHE